MRKDGTNFNALSNNSTRSFLKKRKTKDEKTNNFNEETKRS